MEKGLMGKLNTNKNKKRRRGKWNGARAGA